MQAQGSRGILGMMYEGTYGVKPSLDTPAITIDFTKIPIESEGFKGSRNMVNSNVLTGNRHATRPLLGNVDVQGNIATELGSTLGMLLYGACGSVATTLVSGTESLGTALTSPSAVIDPIAQTMTVTVASHGLSVGDTVQITGLTAPTSLNGLYLRVVKVPSVGSFVLRIPVGTSSTFTLGSGTLKKWTSCAYPAYLHTIKSGGACPSFYVEKGFPDIAQYFQYQGVKVGKMSLNLSVEGVQKISFDFSGKEETNSAATVDAAGGYIDLGKNSFTGHMIASITESGGSTILSNKVTKLDLSLDNSLDTGVYCIGGGGKRGALPGGLCKVSGTAEILFEDVALYIKAANGTKTDLVVTITNGTGTGTDGNEQLTITIPELMFKQETPTVSGDKGILISLPFESFYENGANATQLMLALKNATVTI